MIVNDIGDEEEKRVAEVLKRNAVQQRLLQCNFVRMLVVLGRDVLNGLNGGSSGSYWACMPGDIRKLLLEHVCDAWPAMGKTKRQVRQCVHFLMHIENIKGMSKLLTESVGGFRIVEKASGGFEIIQGGGAGAQ